MNETNRDNIIDLMNEIERLRSDLAAMSDSVAVAAKALNDEERENERLRGALDAVTTVEGNIMELERKATQRGARMQIMREWMGFCPSGPTQNLWTDFTHDNPEAAEWFDEDGVPR